MLNNLIMGVCVLILAVLAFVVPFSFAGHTDKVKKSADEGWYYIDYMVWYE